MGPLIMGQGVEEWGSQGEGEREGRAGKEALGRGMD